MKDHILFSISILLLSITITSAAMGEDWPMWRYDANRSAASPHDLPHQLYLQWVQEYPPLEPVWENPLNRDLMQFDKAYEPIVLGNTMYFGSNASDRMVALDTDTGKEKWAFHVGGPVRFPPVGGKGKIYFVSDDGCLYCLNADSGELLWKYRGTPSDRKILGNERLISTWPARGGPVLKDGIVYFASGIWPFMGVFIYALDAETGEEIWVNDSSSSTFMNQPHNSPSFASIAPQGIFVVAGDKLLVPGGRSVPACFDRNTGELLYYQLARHNKTGGAFVCAIDDKFINYHRDQVTTIYDLETGDRVLPRFGNIPVLTGDAFYCLGESITAFDYANMKCVEREEIVKDSDTHEVQVKTEREWILDKLWELEVDSRGDLIKAGNQLYAGGHNIVTALDLSTPNQRPQISWTSEIDGTVARIVAADDKLFVVTLEGRIYTFGGEQTDPVNYPYETKSKPLDGKTIAEAKAILNITKQKDGYCLVYGLENGDLAEALVRHSNLNVIAVDPDREKVDRLRKQFTEADLYGKRLSVQVGNPTTFPAPPYLANLTIFEDTKSIDAIKDQELYENIYKSVRPYGGVICMRPESDNTLSIVKAIQQCKFPQAKLIESDGFLLLIREGALPGSANWTHQYGDIANTVKSDDQLVKLPLGILWFGGSSNTDVLPRHGHGPPEQIVDGRLYIEGIDSLSARDVYTGRVLWKRTFENLGNYGVYYDDTYKDTPLDPAYNQIHIPGANARGTNYVVTKDKVYILEGEKCQVLDPVSGETIIEIELPMLPTDKTQPHWGYIGVYDDYLIAGADIVEYKEAVEFEDLSSKRKPFYNFDITSSKRLIVMNRHTGDVFWTFNSELGFRHNTIVAGNGKLFCIDRMPDAVIEKLKRRGKTFLGTPRLLAFDIKTGNILWSSTENIFGTWLGYSAERDILLQACRDSRDMLAGEPDEGMAAYRGKDGKRLWRNEARYGGPCILHDETIITEPYAFNLRTGEQKMRTNPLTGEETPWMFKRNYGCNYAIGSEHLLTFRSAAAGFYDLERDGGTGNFGGFKSGCTSNLIAANGLLNAPDYTRTCSCSYQNQSSLAMIHDPGVEIWTFNPFSAGEGEIKRVGINLGAPGDRRADNGTLWLEYPQKGSPSPEVTIHTEPETAFWFHHHTSRFSGEDLKWVAASGIKGVRKISLRLSDTPQPAQTYTVRLIFAEPEQLNQGDRIFNVSIQDRKVLQDFDILNETEKIRHSLIKEFRNIPVSQDLLITLDPSESSTIQQPILSGIEVISETLLSRTQ